MQNISIVRLWHKSTIGKGQIFFGQIISAPTDGIYIFAVQYRMGNPVWLPAVIAISCAAKTFVLRNKKSAELFRRFFEE